MWNKSITIFMPGKSSKMHVKYEKGTYYWKRGNLENTCEHEIELEDA
jgi:hypothetical protein